MPDSKDDTHWMQLAIKHARKGIATCSPNPPVGAVIVIENRIIARTHNLTETLNDVTAHADANKHVTQRNPDQCQ